MVEYVKKIRFRYFQDMRNFENQISKYFQDQEYSILNRGPFNSNYMTDWCELIESNESISISNQSICDIYVTQACYEEAEG